MEVRRPLYYMAVAFTTAILFVYYFGWIAAAAAETVLILWAWRCRQASQLPLLILITFTVSLGSFLWHEQRLAADPALEFADQEVTAVGIVEESDLSVDPEGDHKLKLQVRTRSLLSEGSPEADGTDCSGSRILATIPADLMGEENAAGGSHESSVAAAVVPDSVVRISGTLRIPDGKRNPNCFDYRLFLKAKGIQTTIYAVEFYAETPEHLTWQSRLFLIREHYLERIREHAGDKTAGLIRAILFGDKGQLEEETRETFQKNGTAHILAVSGLHVGILYGALGGLWSLLAGWLPQLFGARKGKRFFCCMALFFFGYAFLSGYAPSVVRAVCMVLLHAFANMTGRRYDLNCAAFAVGICAMLHQPYILFQAGFQMSFLAILTLGLVTPYIRRIYTGAFVGSLAIQAGLGPYILYQFNTVSLIAVLINVPVISLAGILVPAALAGMVLPVPGGGAGGEGFLVFFSGLYDQGLARLCDILLNMNDLCCIDHVTALTAASPHIGFIVVYYLGLLVFASEEGRRVLLRRRMRMAAGMAAGVILVSACFGLAVDDGYRNCDLVFVDVGQGDCMHLRSGGRNYLIDGGGSTDYEVGTEVLQPYLLKNGVSRIDGAFITHLHTDHYQGICELARTGMVDRIFVYEANRLKLEQICRDTGLAEDAVTFLHRGQTVWLDGERNKPEGDRVQVLWPGKKSDAEYGQMVADDADENASSLIMRVSLGGVSLLATGDLGEEGEAQLMDLYENADGPAGASQPLRADILKVGHHGSKSSSSEAFLDAVLPKTAVIQVGEHNMYGHPAPEALTRLSQRNIPVYRNDLQGAVGMKLREGRIRVRTLIMGVYNLYISS